VNDWILSVRDKRPTHESAGCREGFTGRIAMSRQFLRTVPPATLVCEIYAIDPKEAKRL
jgi:hypothetical protein